MARLTRTLSRFVRPGDEARTDAELVTVMLARWQAYLSEPIIDVGE